MTTYEMALRRAQSYTPRERVLVLLNFDKLWEKSFGVEPTDEQRQAYQKAFRANLTIES